MFRFKSDSEDVLFWVNKALLFEKSRCIRRVCGADPQIFSVAWGRVFGDAPQRIVDYFHNDAVPIGPGPTKAWDDPEALSYTDMKLKLYFFAEDFEIEDFANRVLDELQTQHYRGRGRLLGYQIEDIYESTNVGSLLRRYCAVGTLPVSSKAPRIMMRIL